MIGYMGLVEAQRAGYTESFTSFGIPCWGRYDSEGVLWVRAKFAPLTRLVFWCWIMFLEDTWFMDVLFEV